MHTFRLGVAVLLAAVLAACTYGDEGDGGGGPAAPMGPGISVSEAMDSTLEGPLLVNGYVVSTSRETRLCESLAESHPPQCGGASLRVEGLDLETLERLDSAEGVRWTPQPTQVLGEVEDGTLTVSTRSTG